VGGDGDVVVEGDEIDAVDDVLLLHDAASTTIANAIGTRRTAMSGRVPAAGGKP
jgi:hypothetical protein